MHREWNYKMIEYITPLQKSAIKQHKKMVIKFKTLKEATIFKDVPWDDNIWPYSQRLNLNFSYQIKGSKIRENLSKDMADSAKCFVVYVLDNSKSNHLSHSYLSKLIHSFNYFYYVLNLEHPCKLTKDLYDSLIQYIQKTFQGVSVENNVFRLNRAVRFLKEHCIVPESIDTINPKIFSKRDESGIKDVNDDAMPSRLTVKAVIDLKHKIFKKPKKSGRYKVDRLCINTQAFLYGLGLRIGEVLRLPYDCLVSIGEDLFLRVWTEKGQIPIARYIPKLWRQVIIAAIEDIKTITEPYRKIAKHCEKHHTIPIIENRMEQRIKKINKNMASFNIRLTNFMTNKIKESKKLWKLKPRHQKLEILPNEVLAEIDYLPIKFSIKPSIFVGQCKIYGIKPESCKIANSSYHRHFVRKTELERWLNERIVERSKYITEEEFFNLIIGNKGSWKNHSEIRAKTVKLKQISRKSFYPNKNVSTCIEVMPVGAVKKLSASILSGGYDYSIWIVEKEFFQLFPEVSTYEILPKNSKKLRYKKDSAYIIRRNKKNRKVIKFKKRFKLIDIESIHEYFYGKFKTLNEKAENEILEIEKLEDSIEDDSIKIQSQSFSVRQKISDFLFLHPSRKNCNGFVPQILSYYTLYYFFKGYTTEVIGKNSAFRRYKLNVPDEIIESYKTHMGRHWQTTSLFRAGAQDWVVDLFMGREPGQGRKYDHNTGVERARKIKDLLLKYTDNFIGEIADKVRVFRKEGKTDEEIMEYLDHVIVSVHWTPYGACIRNLALKPCQYNVRCIRGQNGEGCSEFIVNKSDDEAIAGIKRLVKKSEMTLGRLFNYQQQGHVHADKHIDFHREIAKNGRKILWLVSEDAENIIEFKPFPNGSSPDLCPFQSGEVINL